MISENCQPTRNGEWRPPQQQHKTSREEDTYFDLGDYPLAKQQPPPLRGGLSSSHHHSNSSSSHEAPLSAYPTTQPPSAPPPGRNGSAGSSQNGGYYSSNSSCAMGPTTSYHQNGNRRESLIQSIGSRAASVEDEDDGFYDNIGIYGSAADDRRFSRGSELGGGDSMSLSSARLPPSSKHGRLGSFLSKLGGRSNGGSLQRPPGSAASLVSLNKVAVEAPIQHVGSLMKSSSLSNEPWRKQIIEEQGKQRGFGARLKNSLFGSKKRLN